MRMLDNLRMCGRMLEAAIAVLLLASTFGCSQRQAQSTVQASLTSLAHGLEAASEGAAEQLGDAPAQARAYVVDERSQNPGMSVDVAMELYREQLESWYQLSHALNLAHHALLLGQSSLNAWIDTGELPDRWGEFCESISGLLVRIPPLLEELGIGVPDMLQQALPYADTVCEIAAAFFSQRE